MDSWRALTEGSRDPLTNKGNDNREIHIFSTGILPSKIKVRREGESGMGREGKVVGEVRK